MVKNWQSQFEKLFDSSTEKLNLQELKKQFEILDDLNSISNISYVYSGIERKLNWKSFLGTINNYFEVVALFRTNKITSETRLYQLQAFAVDVPCNKIEAKLKLPKVALNSVLSTNGYQLLNKFNLGYLTEEKKANGFLFQIRSNMTLLVVTQTAEPWLKLKIEKLHESLMRINFEDAP